MIKFIIIIITESKTACICYFVLKSECCSSAVFDSYVHHACFDPVCVFFGPVHISVTMTSDSRYFFGKFIGSFLPRGSHLWESNLNFFRNSFLQRELITWVTSLGWVCWDFEALQYFIIFFCNFEIIYLITLFILIDKRKMKINKPLTKLITN